MILQAKARPVKIRIKSGGLEHSSLESLKSHFQLKDVCQLLDGRLYRWLLQLGHEDLAEQIKDYTADVINYPPSLLCFYHKFFLADQKDTGKYNNLSDWAFYLIDKADPSLHQQGLNLARDVVRLNKEDAKKMYRSGKLPDEDWIAIFQDYEKEEDADIYYNLSLEYNKCDSEKSRDYLVKAAGLNHEGAQNKLKEQDKAAKVEPTPTSTKRSKRSGLLGERYPIEKMLDLTLINQHWKQGQKLRYEGSSGTVRTIYNFINSCLDLKRRYQNPDIYQRTSQEFTAAFDEYLHCQSEFVLGLLWNHINYLSSTAWELQRGIKQNMNISNPNWEKIKGEYEPANYMLDTSATNLPGRNKPFKTWDFERQLDYFITHLSEF